RRVVTVRVVLNNKDNLFKPGMFLEGVIEGTAKSSSEDVITVPRSAVLWTGKRSLVYVKPDPSQPVFEMREVTLGDASGDNYVILDGLQGGEEIVTNGTFTVDAAAQLQGKKSMMGAQREKPSDKISAVTMKMDLNEAFENAFTGVKSNYIALKDAFVQSDVAEVQAQAKNT